MNSSYPGGKFLAGIFSLLILLFPAEDALSAGDDASRVSPKIEELTAKIQSFMPAPRGAGRTPKVAIIELENLSEGARRNNIGKIVSELLTTSMVHSGSFAVVERDQLSNVLKELSLNQTGLVDVTSAKAVGKMLAADAIVCGSVSEVGRFFDVNVRLIDVESASIISAAVVEIPHRDFLASLAGGGQARNLMERMQANLDTLDTAIHLYSAMHSGSQSDYEVVFPKGLEDLVPEYLDRLPDPIQGEWDYNATTGKVHNTAYPSLAPTQVHINKKPFLDKAREISLLSSLRTIEIALKMYYSEYGRWPKALDDLVPHFIPGLPDAKDGAWQYDPEEGKVRHSRLKAGR